MATQNGSANPHGHNHGNQSRSYTPEQRTAVERVQRCGAHDYYDILGIERSATENDVKKAYRKLSLLTHPDKNGFEGADEAFKRVSHAFQILNDAEKRRRYDVTGSDPDSRFGGGGGGGGFGDSGMGSPFARGGGMGGGGRWEEELSPEELFAQFFGAGGFGSGFGGGLGGGFGPGGFTFNLGGGPQFRVHRFGGPDFTRRAAGVNGRPRQPAPEGLLGTLLQWLPFLVLFVLPLLSSLFSGSEKPGPKMRFDEPAPPWTMKRTTQSLKVNYFLDPREVSDYTSSQLRNLDKKADNRFVVALQSSCEGEIEHRDRLVREAQGWFFPDMEKLQRASSMELRSCQRLRSMGLRGPGY